MASEQGRMQREKNQILTDMQRTESVSYIVCRRHSPPKMFQQDIDDVKQQMQKLKKENQRLEKELRGMSLPSLYLTRI